LSQVSLQQTPILQNGIIDKMKAAISLLALLFFLSCVDREKNCLYTKDQLLKENEAKIFSTKEEKGVPVEFRDKGKDSIAAGYYSFYDNGGLKSYEYFSTMRDYVYGEQYDRKGALIKIEGIPLVHKYVKLNSDSLVIRMYFFALGKKYKNVNIITADNREVNLSLLEDTLYSNMKSACFTYYNLKEKQDIITYVNGDYEDLCNKETRSFKDTISLSYTP
jgi:hypothetical protein